MSGRRRPAPPAPAQGHAPAQTQYPQQVHSQQNAEVALRSIPNDQLPPHLRTPNLPPPTRRPARGAAPPAYAPPPAVRTAQQARYVQDGAGAWGDAPDDYADEPQRPSFRNFSERVRGVTEQAVSEGAQYAHDELEEAVGEQAALAGLHYLELLQIALTTVQSPLTRAIEDRVNWLADQIDGAASVAQGLYHGSRRAYGDEATRGAGDLAHDVPAVARLSRVLCETILRPEVRGQSVVVEAPPRAQEPPPVVAEPPAPAKGEKTTK